MGDKKYRLVTRSDFDGLICGVLLKEREMIDEVVFVHPKDMQDGKIEITANDITTNLPYVPGCHLCFDHHWSESERHQVRGDNHIIDPNAPSAARVVFEYLGGPKAFPNLTFGMMTAVDQADAALFSEEEILKPEGWTLLNFLMDARTGLGRFKEFRVSNFDLMMDLIEYCRMNRIHQVLELPDVKERVDLYFQHEPKFIKQLKTSSTVHDNLVVVDYRDQETIWAGNRFMVYALFRDCAVSLHVIWGKDKQNTVFAMGKSIINPFSNINIGALMLEFGGGGHKNAGTCQIDNDKADEVLQTLIQRVNEAE